MTFCPFLYELEKSMKRENPFKPLFLTEKGDFFLIENNEIDVLKYGYFLSIVDQCR